MSNIDDQIKAALRREDEELFAEFDSEASLPELVFESFRGRHRAMVAMTWFMTLVFFVGMVFCLYKVFTSEDFHHHILWALGFIFTSQGVAMLKMWNWMELNRLAVTREIKRVELQIATLAKRMGDG